MPRKKLVKSRVVKKVKRQAKSLAAAMEKEFKSFPKKLQEQFRKDLAALKKQEPKMHASLQKLQKQYTSAKNKHSVLAEKVKVKPTPTVKKQLAAMMKTCDKLSKAVSALTDQLNEIKAQGKVISIKKARFAALAKYMSNLENEWARSQSENDVAEEARSVRKSPAKRKKQAPEANEITVLEEPMMTETPEEVVESVE